MHAFRISVDLTVDIMYFQGYDPLEQEKFVPRHKKKGRSSAGSVEKRKKKVAYEDQRVSGTHSWIH